jgi:hypothetical protein
MKALGSRVAAVWCHMTHPAPMWPVNGYYICPTCLRAHPVPWEHPTISASRPAKVTVINKQRVEAVGRSTHVMAAAASR